MQPDEEIKIQQIIAALEYLKRTAEKGGLEDFAELIDSTFKICANTYIILKRSEMAAELEAFDRGLKVIK